MTVVRIKKTNNFVTLYKGCLLDVNISLKAKGLWAYCMAQKDDWHFHVTQLADVLKEGKDAIYSALKELIEHGYCKRIYNKDGTKFAGVDYEINEIPTIFQENLPQRGFPDTENPPLLKNIPNNKYEPKHTTQTTREGEAREKSSVPSAVAGASKEKKKKINTIEELIDKFRSEGKTWEEGEIREAWEIMLSKDEAINDIARFVEGVIVKLRLKKTDTKKNTFLLENMKLKDKLEKFCGRKYLGKVEVGPDHVNFPEIYDGFYKVSDVSFREKVINALRKIGIPIN